MIKIKQLLIYLGAHKFLSIRKLPEFIFDYFKFNSLSNSVGVENKFNAKLTNIYPIFLDKTATHGFDRHYIFHTAWSARIVKKINPQFLVDISSSLYFSAIVSAFIPVKFYDYRPAELSLSGLTSKQGDLMRLPIEDNSLDCISCMHVIEHVGLGRYGDPVDPNADYIAIKELIRVTKPGGHIIYVTPVGKSAVKFNAHRIYSFEQILERFPGCEVEEFSLIQDDAIGGSIITNADPMLVSKQLYGCGLFHFKKK